MPTITFTPLKDAYIYQRYPTENFGSSPYLYISRYKGAGTIFQSLLQFDLCSLHCNYIPPGSSITKAYLEFPQIYLNNIPPVSIVIYAFRLLQSWDEKTVNWNNPPLPGAFPESTATVTSGYTGNTSIDITGLVRGWYDGSIVNNGVLIRGDESKDSLLAFYSRDIGNTNFWPRLVVNY